MAGIALFVEDVDVEVDPEASESHSGQLPSLAETLRTQIVGREDDQIGQLTVEKGCDVDGLVGVPRSQDNALSRRRRGTPGRADPRRRTEAESDGERHVGSLARGRRGPVVDVHMPVDVDDTDRARSVPDAGKSSGDERAASPENERALAHGHHVADRSSHLARHREDVGRADDPGLRIAHLTANADVEVAAIYAAEALDESSLAERGRRELGPAGPADRVDGNPERSPFGHGLDASIGERLNERSFDGRKPARAAVRLRGLPLVQPFVGSMHERGAVGRLVRELRPPEGDSKPGLGMDLLEASCELTGFGVRTCLDERRKLVAADARDYVAHANRCREEPSDARDQPVALCVAVLIVDPLEGVDVAVQEPERLPTRDTSCELVVQSAGVQELGQVVPLREGPQLGEGRSVPAGEDADHCADDDEGHQPDPCPERKERGRGNAGVEDDGRREKRGGKDTSGGSQPGPTCHRQKEDREVEEVCRAQTRQLHDQHEDENSRIDQDRGGEEEPTGPETCEHTPANGAGDDVRDPSSG